MGTPAAEVEIDVQMVEALLTNQHPDLSGLPVRAVTSGWDNAIYRLGDDYALRLPRRAQAAALVLHEQRWLPMLQGHLPVQVPVPLRVGVPQGGYPWHWSIVPWLCGDTADVAPLGDGAGVVLARFCAALHQPAPADAPRNPYRGVALSERDATFRDRFARLQGRTDLADARALAIWEDALTAPVDVTDTWLHGDMHPRNVLVRSGHLAAVIDWGDVARGDRACDLACVWMLLPDGAERARAMRAMTGATPATWRRARGWAALYSLLFLHAGLSDDAPMAAIGAQTLTRLHAGP